MIVAKGGLLIINPQAGGLSEEDEVLLRRELSGFEAVRLKDGQDLTELLDRELPDDAAVVVAGGDGTVAAAAHALAGTGRTLGIVPLGTFNNFGRAIGMPLEVAEAARAIVSGRPGTVTLGRINGRPFLEAASIGLFGDLINLGEAAKELRYGELVTRVRELSSPSFEYEISGDLNRRGRARAMVAANIPSTGALVRVGNVRPEEPVLELSVMRAGARAEILRRLAGRALPFLRAPRPGRRIRRVRIQTEPAVSVYADADRVAETPAEVEIHLHALKVILPS